MRRLRLACYVAVGLFASVSALAQSGAPDIKARITGLWGIGSDKPIVIFGKEASLGEWVSANLDRYYDGGDRGLAGRDPIPTHSLTCEWYCGYPISRNIDFSAISRVFLSHFRTKKGFVESTLLLIDCVDAAGAHPGSEGEVVITDPRFRFKRKPLGLIPDWENGQPDNYLEIRKRSIRWKGRGGCPACACPEVGFTLAVLILRKE